MPDGALYEYPAIRALQPRARADLTVSKAPLAVELTLRRQLLRAGEHLLPSLLTAIPRTA